MSHIPASTGYTGTVETLVIVWSQFGWLHDTFLSVELSPAGAGATVINDDIDRHSPGNVVASHLEHDQHKGHACCQGIHAAHGGAGGPADHESVPSAGVSCSFVAMRILES